MPSFDVEAFIEKSRRYIAVHGPVQVRERAKLIERQIADAAQGRNAFPPGMDAMTARAVSTGLRALPGVM